MGSKASKLSPAHDSSQAKKDKEALEAEIESLSQALFEEVCLAAFFFSLSLSHVRLPSLV